MSATFALSARAAPVAGNKASSARRVSSKAPAPRVAVIASAVRPTEQARRSFLAAAAALAVVAVPGAPRSHGPPSLNYYPDVIPFVSRGCVSGSERPQDLVQIYQ